MGNVFGESSQLECWCLRRNRLKAMAQSAAGKNPSRVLGESGGKFLIASCQMAIKE